MREKVNNLLKRNSIDKYYANFFSDKNQHRRERVSDAVAIAGIRAERDTYCAIHDYGVAPRNGLMPGKNVGCPALYML